MIDHTPKRPSWSCRFCGNPWPCAPARAILRREHAKAPAQTALHLISQYSAAVIDMADLADVEADDLYRRIVSWVKAPE